MKNYILRICRHDKDNPALLVGVVEDPEKENKKSFGSMDELWKILNAETEEIRLITKIQRKEER